MIGKVPKEELNALFYEIYKKEENVVDISSEEENLKEPIYIFYGYKFKAIFNSFLSQEGMIPAFVKDFKLKKFNKEIKKTYIGYSLEKKYRIFFDIENSNVLKKDKNSIFDTLPFDIIIKLIEDLANVFLSNLNLTSSKLNSSYTYFYTDEIIEYKYDLYIEEKLLILSIYLEKDFLDSGLISNWILSYPTPEEKRRIGKLKKKINLSLDIESEPVQIDLHGSNIKLPSNLKFEIKND